MSHNRHRHSHTAGFELVAVIFALLLAPLALVKLFHLPASCYFLAALAWLYIIYALLGK